MVDILEVLKYPNPILRRGGVDVTEFDDELAKTARAMLDTMYSYRGVGLAAPQVGIELKLLVLNPEGDPANTELEMVMVNPKILSRKKLEYGEEGCLSFPGIYAEVERHHTIRVQYRNLAGEALEAKVEDFLARVILHEIDHLQGVLFVDRLSPTEAIGVRSKLLEMERAWQS